MLARQYSVSEALCASALRFIVQPLEPRAKSEIQLVVSKKGIDVSGRPEVLGRAVGETLPKQDGLDTAEA
jgi:hypothetical protein